MTTPQQDGEAWQLQNKRGDQDELIGPDIAVISALASPSTKRPGRMPTEECIRLGFFFVRIDIALDVAKVYS